MSTVVSPTQKERLLIEAYLAQSDKIVPELKIRWAERLDFGDMPAMRLGLSLPQGIAFDGNEALTLRDLAVTISTVEKHEFAVSMTPVHGEGQLLQVDWLPATRVSEDASILYKSIGKTASSLSFADRKLAIAAVILIVGLLALLLLKNTQQAPLVATKPSDTDPLSGLQPLPPPPLPPPAQTGPTAMSPLPMDKFEAESKLTEFANHLRESGDIKQEKKVREALSLIKSIEPGK